MSTVSLAAYAPKDNNATHLTSASRAHAPHACACDCVHTSMNSVFTFQLCSGCVRILYSKHVEAYGGIENAP